MDGTGINTLGPVDDSFYGGLPNTTGTEITSTDQAMQDLKDLTALEKAGYSLSDIENLTNAQMAAGLGRDVVAGFAQELALRIAGTKTMFEDAFGE